MDISFKNLHNIVCSHERRAMTPISIARQLQSRAVIRQFTYITKAYKVMFAEC